VAWEQLEAWAAKDPNLMCLFPSSGIDGAPRVSSAATNAPLAPIPQNAAEEIEVEKDWRSGVLNLNVRGNEEVHLRANLGNMMGDDADEVEGENC
jgi:hypothetical protein